MKATQLIKKFAESIQGVGDYETAQAIKNQMEKTLIPLVKQNQEQLFNEKKIDEEAMEVDLNKIYNALERDALKYEPYSYDVKRTNQVIRAEFEQIINNRNYLTQKLKSKVKEKNNYRKKVIDQTSSFSDGLKFGLVCGILLGMILGTIISIIIFR